jgi:hypothetical protein
VEATTLAETAADCLRGVPLFDRHRAQWIGQFQLNVAQLRSRAQLWRRQAIFRPKKIRLKERRLKDCSTMPATIWALFS